jgi:predicted MFS family arabinose efflux permease
MRIRNYRLYFFGQLVSTSGTWMQIAAQAWLVVRLTNSGTALGLLWALQFLPLLVAGAWGGLVVDRTDKRRLLFVTQASAGLLAATLGLLTATHHVTIGAVYVLAFLLGWVNVFDNPARQAFVVEMVGPDEVANAVSLNSVMFNSGRIVGPALAGIAIGAVGMAACFFVNAASYAAALIALFSMRVADLHRAAPAERRAGQLRDGFRYVVNTPELRVPLVMMAVIGTLAFNFQVVTPLIVKQVFHRGATTFAWVMSLSGAGAVVGGLATAMLRRPTARVLAGVALAMGVAELAAAGAPTLGLEAVAITFLGGAGIAYVVLTNASLQVASDPAMRGRVMALFGMAFLGSTPIGAPLVGWISNHYGARSGFAIGGIAALVCGLAALPGRRSTDAISIVDSEPALAESAVA